MDAAAAAGGRTYEDFTPPYRMVRETPAHTLSVDLSGKGYKKEHIKVQVVHSRRRLVVSGECPAERWSRFRLEFQLPDGCDDVKGILARFDNGVVRVTMPPAKTAAGSSVEQRRWYRSLLQERRKLATTLFGVLLALLSFGIYVRYSVKP
ncbi:inactive protein RESTRICTED TEV MOVEMENT 2-like [Oryza brachyantha]|uniref:inactive protein RESTRICTED TEV MOVEMENT 2-like n=1 Tax=Oryza brachyantha TaxID=4533 RepID=UPI0003EAD949|nr:inactive protein RESTRICTED TEV MOVEMENT 2-like [Oryza brachyantha]